MWNSVRRRDLVATLSVALIIASLSALPQFDRLRGLSIDILTWARWSIAGNRHDPAKSPAVVVAVDEETYRRKPFSGTPSITWTREIAKILTAVAEGGATVVGFDIILPTSLEQSEIPLGTETLGERLRGFDRDFLRALAILARQGKVLLGQVQHLHRPIQPFEAQRVAVGQQANIRPLNLFADRDGVVRRVPLSFEVDGAAMPSMSVELAARAMGRKPQFEPDGSLSFGGAKVPQAVPNTLTINFEGGADDIPTAFAGRSRCLCRQGRQGVLPPPFRQPRRPVRRRARRGGPQSYFEATGDRQRRRPGAQVPAAVRTA